MENYERCDVSTTRKVEYEMTGTRPGWVIKRPGSYAPGYEHLDDELWHVRRVTFHFGMEDGVWQLHEITLSLTDGEDPGRFNHLRITSQDTGRLPWWLVAMTARAAQEPWS